MNRLRQAEETLSSRSAVGLNERLATPPSEDLRQSPQTGTFRHHLRRIDVVATPAVMGTTVAWGTMVLVRWLLGTEDIGWIPSTRVLLIAYAATIALSFLLAHVPKRAHAMHAAVATFLGFTYGCAYTYGEYQHWSWAVIAGSAGMRELILRNVGAIALYVLVMGILWLPAVFATYYGRKTLAQRLREREKR